MTQVEALAKYADRASFATLGATPLKDCRDPVADFGEAAIDVDRRKKLRKC
jgi:hypothetical protein